MKIQDFRVSVVITSYNQKDYLIETIESVINQTVKPHEIIIADDHSTKDDSVELIKNYMNRYPGWIKGVFQERNLGIPKNRNAALRQVTGNYVSILDGDDRFVPDKLERELEAFQKNPNAECIYSNVSFIDSQSQFLGIRDKENQPDGDIFIDVVKGKFGLLRSLLMKYDLLKEIGFLNERFPGYDGFDLTVLLSKRCEFVYISNPLVEYRIHNNNYTGNAKAADHLKDLKIIHEKIQPLLVDISVKERKQITKIWSKRLFKLRVREALDSGNIAKAFFIASFAALKGDANLANLPNKVSNYFT